MASATVAVTASLTVSSKSIFDLQKDFATLLLITELNDAAFKFTAMRNGIFGSETLKTVEETSSRKFVIKIPQNWCRWDLCFVSLVCASAFVFISWVS